MGQITAPYAGQNEGTPNPTLNLSRVAGKLSGLDVSLAAPAGGLCRSQARKASCSGGTCMVRTLTFIPLASLLLSGALADEPKGQQPAASELLSTGLAKANDQGRRVFLLFGSPG
jgi:hypothetical protein